MSKLKLLIGVGICGIVFSGCGFFDDMGDIFGVGKIEYKETQNCVPADLKERLANKSFYRGHSGAKQSEYFKTIHGYYEVFFTDLQYNDKTKCYDLALEAYKEAVKNAKKLPTNIDEENAFRKEWNICDKMPDWLNKKLDEYVSQNGTEASTFKQTWQKWLSGKAMYNKLECNKGWLPCNSKYNKSAMERCRAIKTATKAIENDLIDLGNGKKAKCADLSYKDAHKCLAHFETAYNKIYKEKGMPLEGCTPIDLKERLASYTTTSSELLFSGITRKTTRNYSNYYDEPFEWRNEAVCNDFLLHSYNEAIKKAKKLPTSFAEEEEFAKEWLYCNTMPKWLNKNLDEYISQNKDNDIEYVNASKFKESWQNKLDGNSSFERLRGWGALASLKVAQLQGKEADFGITSCFANRKALKAIENDLIDLGNGKKAKCADLSYKDAPKCLAHFNSVYNKTYKAKEKEVMDSIKAMQLKIERLEYEKKNKK